MAKLEKIEEKLDNVEDMNNGMLGLYKEILHEQRKSNKRMFAIVVIEAFIIISMFIGFLIYESQYEEVSEIQEMEQIQENTTNSNMSGVIN